MLRNPRIVAASLVLAACSSATTIVQLGGDGGTEGDAGQVDAGTDVVEVDSDGEPDASDDVGSDVVVDAPPDVVEAAPPPNAFTGASAYASVNGGATDNASHSANFTSANVNNPNDPIGQNCLSCHTAGGAAAGAQFVIGGSIYASNAGTTPVGAGREVRVRFTDGTAMSTHTDNLGNFYLKTTDLGAKPLAAGALVGVRDSTEAVMTTAITGPANAGCNQAGCHNKGGATGVIHLP